MSMIIPIRKGLNLPVTGVPVQDIKYGPRVTKVALIGPDYLGMKPTMMVQVGDSVKRGQALFQDKKTEGIVYTSPASGVVAAINRGDKRVFRSIEITVGDGGDEIFPTIENVNSATAEHVRDLMLKSGVWVGLRSRPFERVADPAVEPHSIFVTAIDTNPLAAEPELVIDQQKDLFVHGLALVSKLTKGKTFVCTRDDSRVPGRELANVEFHAFAGPHPAGLPGTHIHFLDPVGPHKTVWHINYQDVIALGHLARTGRVMTEKVISIAGPRVKNPGLYRVTMGSDLMQLVGENANLKNARVISGSILSGRRLESPVNYLGRYHNQVSVIEEGNERVFLGWQRPGGDKFSITRAFLGSWLGGKVFPLNSSLEGGHRGMVPIGTYERVMPLDILPTQLLRALITKDNETAQDLGCLELSEEDLALCTFVCPGKYDYGPMLRASLEAIEKDG